MGTTLTALNSDAGVAVVHVVAIEGIPYLLSDNPSAALSAFDSSSVVPLQDYSQCLGGLTVHWEQSQKIEPWKPFTDPPTLTFSVVPSVDHNGDDTDAFGAAVARRSATNETYVSATVDCNDTTINVLRPNDFASSGDLYLGPETIGYSSKDNGARTFTVAANGRGKYCPFQTDTGARFARTHKLITPDGQSVVQIQPVVASGPTTWIGRWVGVWILRDPSPASAATIDEPGEGHLAYAGVIASVAEGPNGETVVTLEEVRRRIFETVLHREPFRGQLKEGRRLFAGEYFSCRTQREISTGGSTVGDANVLLVVASGASGANQINEGTYSVVELGEAINRWLASERAATRTLFHVRYTALAATADGIRSQVTFNDPTSTSGLDRRVVLAHSRAFFWDWLGWGHTADPIRVLSATRDGSLTSTAAPRKYDLFSSVELTNTRGSFDSQGTLLPASIRVPDYEGVFKVGDVGYVRVKQSGSRYLLDPFGLEGYLTAGQRSETVHGIVSAYTVEDDVTLEIQQVMILEGKFNSLLLKILLSTGTPGFDPSTGTGGYNSNNYDALSEGLGCAIPYSLLGSGFITDLLNCPDGDKSLCAIIDKPTRFVDLFEADFLLRRCFFRWIPGSGTPTGRLGMGSWRTPTSAAASITLDETTKAVPAATAATDRQRATLKEDDGSFYNVLKVKSGRRGDGSYADELTIIDAASYRDFGPRVRTIEARNTAGPGAGTVALDVQALLTSFRGDYTLFSRPFWRVKRTLARTHFYQATVGVVASLTDKFLRDPATGLRYDHRTATGGISTRPALVIGEEFDIGGPGRETGGEVELMILPRQTTGAYVPTAQVDDTATNAGYDAGTFTLTCYAHEHTQSSDAVDVSFFAAGDKVRIVEIDPSDPSNPTTWLRTISSKSGNTITLTAALSSPAWDTALKYRIVYDSYTAVVTDQQAKVFQADDVDGLVSDTRQPYHYIASGPGQSLSFDESVATEVPARYTVLAYGDGVGLSTGYARDIARLANNLVSYKTAPQTPQVYSQLRAARTPTGTWELIECFPVFVTRGTFEAWRTRKLYVAPFFRSTDGTSTDLRVTLSRGLPAGTSRQDVTFVGPYVQNTFTTTSTTFTIPSAAGLDVRHCRLTDGLLGGVAFLSIEVKAKCESRGLARRYLGPVEVA